MAFIHNSLSVQPRRIADNTEIFGFGKSLICKNLPILPNQANINLPNHQFSTMIMSLTLQFHQILPQQKMPVLAQSYKTSLPKRAKAFCHPFKQAARQGCYFFPPLDFDFRLQGELFELVAKGDNGNDKTLTIDTHQTNNQNHYILLSDISPEQSKDALASYRSRIDSSLLPTHIDINQFGFYEVLLNVLVEEPPFGVYIQLWLGGVLTAQPGCNIWVKQAANIMQDSGYTCLDGQINITQWQGWLAIVLKPTRQGQWVQVTKEQPICQILTYPNETTTLQTIPSADIDNEILMQPLKWHVFDLNYGVKPGKYQRQLTANKRKAP